MKILFLTKKLPFPLHDGESVAISHMARALSAQGVEMHLLSFNTSKSYQDIEVVRKGLPFFKRIEAIDLDNRVKKIDAFKNLFTSDSYHISRFISKDFESRLKRMHEEEKYDLIQFESIYLAPYVPTIKNNFDTKIILRTHNIEHLIWDRIVEHTTQPLKKKYLKIQTKRLKEFEKWALNEFHAVISMSSVDLQGINTFISDKRKVRTFITPIYLDLASYEKRMDTENALAFIGSLDWMPNTEGLKWFLEQVFPLIRAKRGDIIFHIAGKNAVDEKLYNQEQVVFHGKVASAQDYIDAYSIFIVPLLSGSGVRVKILEAFALGKAVVSTTIGIEGIDATPDEDFMLSDDAYLMAEQIIALYDDVSKQKSLGTHAKSFVQQSYDAEANTLRLITFYRKLLNNE